MSLSDFASTPAGYVSGVFLPCMCGYGFARLSTKLDKRTARDEEREDRLVKVESAVQLLTYIVNELKNKGGVNR